MTHLEFLKEADAWLSMNINPDAIQIGAFRRSLREQIAKSEDSGQIGERHTLEELCRLGHSKLKEVYKGYEKTTVVAEKNFYNVFAAEILSKFGFSPGDRIQIGGNKLVYEIQHQVDEDGFPFGISTTGVRTPLTGVSLLKAKRVVDTDITRTV